mgnify:CR=1 FL=1
MDKGYIYDPAKGFVKTQGLAATPQGQVQEDTSMFNLDSVLDYFKGLFTPEPEERKEDPAPVPAIPTRYSEKYSSNNPGNVERLKKDRRAGEYKEGGYGADNRFPAFDHPVMGLRAIFMDMNIKNRRHKGDLFKMISAFWMWSENKIIKFSYLFFDFSHHNITLFYFLSM